VIVSAGQLGGTRRIVAPTLAYLAPIAGALVALATGVEHRTVVLAVAASAVLCAVVRAGVEHVRIESARQRADDWLAMRVGHAPADEVLVARIDELLDPKLRATLTRSFRRIACDAVSQGRIVTPAQNNRRVLREHVCELEALADRLGDRTLPVTPRGMALAYRLVTTGGSPLYRPTCADEVSSRLGAALLALDVERVEVGGREEIERAA
jgi:hypothetical protein